MKILFVGFADLSLPRGSTIHVVELVRNLEKRGHEVTVVAQSEGPVDTVRRFVRAGRYMHHKSEILKFLGLLKSMAIAFWHIARLGGDADVIYVRDSIGGALVHWGRFFHKKGFVFEVNGFSSEERRIGHQGPLNSLYAGVMRIIDKTAVKNAARLISVTERMRERLVEDYGAAEGKLTVVCNGVDTNAFKPGGVQERARIKRILGIPHAEKVVGYVGALQAWQGVEKLIAAAPFIIKEREDVKFIIIGDGPLMGSLMDQVRELGMRDKFIFTGIVPHSEIRKYIDIFDVGVVLKEKALDSGYSPLKLYEYMACAKPIVASKVPGFEMIVEENFGILVDPENARDVSSAVLCIISEAGLAGGMGENARRIAIKDFSWSIVSERIESVIDATHKIMTTIKR